MFYPKSIHPSDYLSYYSQVFDFVEINLGDNWNNIASFSVNLIAKKWQKQTPSDFRFSIRVPTAIAMDKQAHSLGRFLEDLAPLEEKVLAVLIDVPLSISLANGREWLESTLASCAHHGYSAVVHFENSSWYQDLAYNLLKRHNATLAWTDVHPTTVITSDFLYLRIGEANQRRWIDKLNEVGDKEIKDIIVVLDSPSHANSFSKSIGLSGKKYNPERIALFELPPISHKSVKGTRLSARKWNDRVIMCVDLNAFYPSCEELRNVSLKGKPHAVIMTDQKIEEITKGVVSSCSYEARQYGIKSAMSLGKALSLCPDLILLPVDIPYYSTVSSQVMEILEEYADVLEKASIDEAFLDCSTKIGPEDPEHYARKIKQAIKEKTGLLCSIGVTSSKSSAKIASDYKKPDGLTVVYPEDLKRFLKPLEVDRVSGIGPKTQQALREIGIHTLGQLAKADVQRLTERFGKNGYWMWKVANGADEEPVERREDHISLSTETTLDSFTRDRQVILGYLFSLVDELYIRAQKRRYLFRTVGIKLVRTDFSIQSREHTYEELQNSRESIANLIEELLSKFILSDDRPAIRKVGLRISHLVRMEKNQEKNAVQRSLLEYYE